MVIIITDYKELATHQPAILVQVVVDGINGSDVALCAVWRGRETDKRIDPRRLPARISRQNRCADHAGREQRGYKRCFLHEGIL